jgi:hypothetical protein
MVGGTLIVSAVSVTVGRILHPAGDAAGITSAQWGWSHLLWLAGLLTGMIGVTALYLRQRAQLGRLGFAEPQPRGWGWPAVRGGLLRGDHRTRAADVNSDWHNRMVRPRELRCSAGCASVKVVQRVSGIDAESVEQLRGGVRWLERQERSQEMSLVDPAGTFILGTLGGVVQDVFRARGERRSSACLDGKGLVQRSDIETDRGERGTIEFGQGRAGTVKIGGQRLRGE